MVTYYYYYYITNIIIIVIIGNHALMLPGCRHSRAVEVAMHFERSNYHFLENLIGSLAFAMHSQCGAYPMYNTLAVQKGHGRGHLQGSHGHSAQVWFTEKGAAACPEPPLLHSILHKNSLMKQV